MKIIGHRGAAGLAPENTLKSIKAAVKAGADYIELDIRMTRDRKLVINHDTNLSRTYNVNLSIKKHTLEELQTVCPDLPTLSDALDASKTEGVILEPKEFIEPERILAITNKYQKLDVRFASFNHHFIRAIKKKNPNTFCYVLEHHSPFDIINRASKMKADGIGLNYGVLNPLTYLLAKRKKLHIYTYTVNKPWIAAILSFMYKDVYICTDVPNKLQYLKK
jgi:glycerophosphoryl diester phosphodiesterase